MSLRFPLLVAALLAASAFSRADTVTPNAVADHYAVLVHASYEDAATSARQMQAAINTFLTAPDNASLQAARQAWRDAREWYGQTEAFRFSGGPIDDEHGPEGRINSWPMDEAYVDYVKGRAKAGIINNPKIKLSRETLEKLNQKHGEENVSTGWHAIEFLLWGQDLDPNGPGQRAFTDFVDGKAPHADRRRTYLKLVTDLLVDDLDSVAKAWAPGAANYRAAFTQDADAIRKILTGAGTLSRGELAGERIEVALSTKAQEDEHSCFSDNTHRDIVANAQGIQNVWEGKLTRRDGSVISGPAIRDLVATKDARLAASTSAAMARTVALANAIQAPFDREIMGKDTAPGRKRLRAVIDALKVQANELVRAARLLGIKQLNTKV
ncbi:imelysin family protein [Chitinimonas sp. BJYL2]|uniref:imelysin family protein n=1 Tax=Chitinimonas sp. BJYL2 TaxID=2976696 RepID=UPI0022B2FE0B|nr:imelysin family protein [Chitinimonas sp. BJYL2]